MEIEVNEYIRTNKGYIFHNLTKQQLEGLKLLNVQYGSIVKHSHDIIDLIEVGDILEFKEGNDICYLGLEKDTETMNYNDIREGIKNGECQLLAILTKEKFTQNCYKVEV